MKGIKQIVEDLGFELSDEQVTALDEAVRENYATRAELDEKKERIEALTSQVEQMTEQVNALDGQTEELTNLKEQVAAYEKAETERKDNEAKKAAFASFETDFTELLGDKKFVNDITAKEVTQRAFEEKTANPSMTLEQVYETVIGDRSDLFANPQQDFKNLPVPSEENPSNEAEYRRVARQLFGAKKD